MPDAPIPAEKFPVIVVGAGAAGLLAATRSAELGRQTLLLEKNRKPGVKILMSGGTRCNITQDCDAAGIISAFGSAGSFLHAPLAALSPQGLIDLLHAEGLATKVEPGGKIFPKSDRATDVLDALLRRLRNSGAELAIEEPVAKIERNASGFGVHTSNHKLECEKLILTTGGKSYPACGTTGDGYRWLEELGHKIHRPRPALVPLVSDDQWVRDLKGITISDTLVSVIDANAVDVSKRKRRRGELPPGLLIERRGAMLFTHFGLSGPAVLDVSRTITGSTDPKKLALLVNFLPDATDVELENKFRSAAAHEGKRLIAGVVAEMLPRRLVDSLLDRANVVSDRRMAELSATERGGLIEQVKCCEIRIAGSRGFEKAEVTAGGVSLDEVSSRDMQSKLVPNLYLAGEILDLDGFIGGYNFQAAFSTGWLAGESV